MCELEISIFQAKLYHFKSNFVLKLTIWKVRYNNMNKNVDINNRKHQFSNKSITNIHMFGIFFKKIWMYPLGHYWIWLQLGFPGHCWHWLFLRFILGLWILPWVSNSIASSLSSMSNESSLIVNRRRDRNFLSIDKFFSSLWVSNSATSSLSLIGSENSLTLIGESFFTIL